MNTISIQHLMEVSSWRDVRIGARHSSAAKMALLEKKFSNLNPDFVDSVGKFGILEPITYDPIQDRLMNGHHRVLVAWLLGIEELSYDLLGEEETSPYLSLPKARNNSNS